MYRLRSIHTHTQLVSIVSPSASSSSASSSSKRGPELQLENAPVKKLHAAGVNPDPLPPYAHTRRPDAQTHTLTHAQVKSPAPRAEVEEIPTGTKSTVLIVPSFLITLLLNNPNRLRCLCRGLAAPAPPLRYVITHAAPNIYNPNSLPAPQLFLSLSHTDTHTHCTHTSCVCTHKHGTRTRTHITLI